MNSGLKGLIFGTLVVAFFIYSFTVYTKGTSIDKGEYLINEQTKNGKIIFQEKNCIACHQIYGLGGYMGPDITNVISAKGKGTDYARAFLQVGSAKMPNYHFSEKEIDELVAYLTYVDKTGISPVINFKINLDGTITQH